MEAIAQNTNQNSTVGENMSSIESSVLPTQNGLSAMEKTYENGLNNVKTADTMTVSNNVEYQCDINKVAVDSLFDEEDESKYRYNKDVVVSESDEIELKTDVVELDESQFDTLLPIQKSDKVYDKTTLNPKETELRETLLKDLEMAQYFTVASLYYYVKVGKQLLEIQKQRLAHSGSLKRIIASVGLNERTAFRYMKIAKDSRFAKMTENHFKSLHHLTQSKMITMTTFTDDKFYEAIGNEDYQFPTKKKNNETKPSEYVMSDDTYAKLNSYDKALVIKKYDDLYKLYIDLKEKIDYQTNEINEEAA